MGWGVTDYPNPPDEEPMPVCPICGQETDTLYLNRDGEVVGCDNIGCVHAVDAYIWEENNE